MLPTIVYREYRPPRALAPYVDCFWSHTSHAGSGDRTTQRVLPDGCIDIIVDVSASVGAEGKVVGAMTRALVVTATDGTEVVAVRFRPGGAQPFLRSGMSELTDHVEPLGDVWPDSGPLADSLARAPGIVGKVAVLAHELTRRLAVVGPVDPFVEAAVSAIATGEARVDRLGERVGLSRQALTRKFKHSVGIGPKKLARVLRMQRVLALAGDVPRSAWAELALEAGYCDQAHMIGELKRLTGLAPGALVSTGEPEA